DVNADGLVAARITDATVTVGVAPAITSSDQGGSDGEGATAHEEDTGDSPSAVDCQTDGPGDIRSAGGEHGRGVADDGARARVGADIREGMRAGSRAARGDAVPGGEAQRAVRRAGPDLDPSRASPRRRHARAAAPGVPRRARKVGAGLLGVLPSLSALASSPWTRSA